MVTAMPPAVPDAHAGDTEEVPGSIGVEVLTLRYNVLTTEPSNALLKLQVKAAPAVSFSSVNL